MTKTLPQPFPSHPHASDEFRHIARAGLILQSEVGSGVHGTAVAGTDDRDELGICLEPPEYVAGLQSFEQFHRHTSWDRPGGLANRSGPGDLDVVIYSARKFCRLALAGNPSILLLLFVPDSAIVHRNEAGAELMANADRFLSRHVADRFLGYLHRQRLGMTGEAGAKVKRPELIAQHGYDTKYAMHAVRLGVQGIELLTTGRVTLPMHENWRDYLLAVRRGQVTLDHVIQTTNELEAELQNLRRHSDVPDEPDRVWVDEWLYRTHIRFWVNQNWGAP